MTGIIQNDGCSGLREAALNMSLSTLMSVSTEGAIKVTISISDVITV